MSADIAIQLKGVSKDFRAWYERPNSIKSVLVQALKGQINTGYHKSFSVLRNVSFDIRKGEFVGIMGRNGAGKSTILKMICGIYQPSSGKITVNGDIAPMIELGSGFHEELSGYENIFLNAAVLGFGRTRTLKSVDKIIEFSELGDFINMPVKNYSSGMLVRLGFSIATHLDAPTLLIDEVLAVGDVGFQAKCLKKIHDLHKAGRTIVLITHDPKAVSENCSRCIVISSHTKVFDGDPKMGAGLYLESALLRDDLQGNRKNSDLPT